MSDDWQPGDLALCVSRHTHYPTSVVVGGAYVVAFVYTRAVNADTGEEGVSLDLKGVFPRDPDGPFSLDCRRFRKLRPHIPDAEDVETLRLMNGTPVRERVA